MKAIHLVVDHNPDAHLAAFHLTPGHRLGVHLYPDQDEAHHLGAGDRPRPATGEVWADYARVQVTLNGCG